MSDMVKLTMEVEVPRDQLPPGYTGRLILRCPVSGESFIDMPPFRGVKIETATTDHRHGKCFVVEVRQPWRVPEHLRDKRFNRMLLKSLLSENGVAWALYVRSKFGNDELYEYASNRTAIPTTLGQILGLTVADFEQMDTSKCYQLGE